MKALEKMGPRQTWIVGIGISLGFFIFGLFLNPSFGITIDEFETIHASRVYNQMVVAFVKGDSLPRWPFHELEGYYFLYDWSRFVFSSILQSWFPSLPMWQAFHIGNLIFSSLSLYLLFRIVFLISHSGILATLSSLTLASFPQFLAHSQNNPKDMIVLFGFVLGIYCCLIPPLLTRRGLMLRSIGIGLSLNSSPLSILVAPIVWVWKLWTRQSSPKAFFVDQIKLWSLGALWGIIFWPWLWDNPVVKIWDSVLHLSRFQFNITELYLGKLVPTLDLPWHFIFVSMFSTTPLIYIVISFFSLPLLSTSSAPPRSRYLFLLGFVWISVGLLVGLKSSLRYNSMRHFLFLLPGISLLAALGMERLSGVFSSSWKKIVAPAIFLSVAAELFFMHPHYGAYLNHAANACVNKNTHLFFDVEYFGNVYREGAFWLNNHAEENAWIYVPIFPFVANTTLLKKSSTVTIEEFKNPQQPIYLMYFTRLRRYNDVIHYAEAHLKPVYEIKRQKATLLKIFKSQAKKQAIF